MVIASALFLFVTILWIYFLWSRRRYYAFAFKMPGPIGLPFIGIVHKIYRMTDILYVLPKIAIQYKVKTYFSWLGPHPLIYTMEPKIAEIILNSPDCIEKSIVYETLNDANGEGILTRKSSTWHKYRKVLNTCFKNKALVSFCPTFNKVSHELCEKLDQHVHCGEVNLKELIHDMSMKASLATVMGINFEEESSREIISYLKRTADLTVQIVLNPWIKVFAIFNFSSLYNSFVEAQNIVVSFVQELALKKIKLTEQQGLKEDDNKPHTMKQTADIEATKHVFIDQAVKFYQRKDFTFNDIILETVHVVFAAFETTAITISSTLMCLAMHPKYQEKLFEEIITYFPEKQFDVSYEDLKNLVYLDMCINETLRVAATLPLVGRECTNDVPLSKDIVIPKGTQIIVDIFNIHRDEDIWGPSAKAFNPNHFLPENLIDHHKYSFMPFLKGLRNCLGWQYAGMIIKIVLVQVLRRYRFSTKFRFEDLRFEQSLTVNYRAVPLLEVHKR